MQDCDEFIYITGIVQVGFCPIYKIPLTMKETHRNNTEQTDTNENKLTPPTKLIATTKVSHNISNKNNPKLLHICLLKLFINVIFKYCVNILSSLKSLTFQTS